MERANGLAIAVALLMSANAMAGPSDANSSTSSATSSTMARDQAEFSAMDTNHDGYVSKSEAQQGKMPDFGNADRNGDGRLDTNEFAMAMDSRSAPGSSSSTQGRTGSSSSITSPNSSSQSSSTSSDHHSSMGQSSDTSGSSHTP